MSLSAMISHMTISERIFERLETIGMTQKCFSEMTGIRQSTISEWKAKKTNPAADKIMIICEALQVTPEWLLTGAEVKGKRRRQVDRIFVDRDTDVGSIIMEYSRLDERRKSRLLGYLDALKEM